MHNLIWIIQCRWLPSKSSSHSPIQEVSNIIKFNFGAKPCFTDDTQGTITPPLSTSHYFYFTLSIIDLNGCPGSHPDLLLFTCVCVGQKKSNEKGREDAPGDEARTGHTANILRCQYQTPSITPDFLRDRACCGTHFLGNFGQHCVLLKLGRNIARVSSSLRPGMCLEA